MADRISIEEAEKQAAEKMCIDEGVTFRYNGKDFYLHKEKNGRCSIGYNDYRRDEGEIIQAGAEIKDEDLFDALLEFVRKKEDVMEW